MTKTKGSRNGQKEENKEEVKKEEVLTDESVKNEDQAEAKAALRAAGEEQIRAELEAEIRAEMEAEFEAKLAQEAMMRPKIKDEKAMRAKLNFLIKRDQVSADNAVREFVGSPAQRAEKEAMLRAGAVRYTAEIERLKKELGE